MKKPRYKQRCFQIWKSAYAIRLSRKLNVKKAKHSGSRRQLGHLHTELEAPSHFVLLSWRSYQSGTDVNKYFEFLSRLRSVTSRDLVIDMSGVKRMVVDAALLFKAELSSLAQVRGVRITAIPPLSQRTQQVLKQTGIDQLLSLNIDMQPSREDVIHWRIAEGPRADVDSSLLEPIMADIELVTGLATHPVYQGIIESIGNCAEHAYKNHPDVTRHMPENPSWWVFQQVKDDVLIVVVCDLGIGVNRALPLALANEPTLLRKLLHVVRRTKGEDNRALLAAMEYGRTSTGLHERGRGMRNAHAVVNDHGEGDFFAISNKGCYVYQKSSKTTDGKYRTLKLRHSINGTILSWRLPLKENALEGVS